MKMLHFPWPGVSFTTHQNVAMSQRRERLSRVSGPSARRHAACAQQPPLRLLRRRPMPVSTKKNRGASPSLQIVMKMLHFPWPGVSFTPVSYTHLRAHETPEHLVCRLLLEKKKKKKQIKEKYYRK
eukprot:TRINITY_DN2440_c0_g1_i8.p2 TRINITY_DN2440_c0_g1~~TRINITY_DN2440_c0_g1_i8.p2  ORF type:complete len:126 (-),score=15.79 TRINITY_DN2440_c0_g1_i8:69-446(-)